MDQDLCFSSFQVERRKESISLSPLFPLTISSAFLDEKTSAHFSQFCVLFHGLLFNLQSANATLQQYLKFHLGIDFFFLKEKIVLSLKLFFPEAKKI